MPKNGFLLYDSYMFDYIRNCQTVLWSSFTFYISINNVWVIKFLHILTLFDIVIILHRNLYYILTVYYDFNLYFPGN